MYIKEFHVPKGKEIEFYSNNYESYHNLQGNSTQMNILLGLRQQYLLLTEKEQFRYTDGESQSYSNSLSKALLYRLLIIHSLKKWDESQKRGKSMKQNATSQIGRPHCVTHSSH